MAWPDDEARRIPAITGRPVLFETGYGPSGLPHIGTFTEVCRTLWVMDRYAALNPGVPVRLLAFSDDMDALRRVPDNVPNQDMLRSHIGMPLTSVPNPFGRNGSFGHHNNAKLRQFLDDLGFDGRYEFASSTAYYKGGMFDSALRRVLACHDEIVDVIRPTLGNERASTYSPLMPIHPVTGQVMMVEIDAIDLGAGMLHWRHDGESFVTYVSGGACKLQWKADWAMRWYALNVDYEMSGKDLIDSVKLSSQICRILGGTPPVNLTYELFLDKEGRKISKSKGNGVSIEEWLRYGPPESLKHFVFANPNRAKKLFVEMIPRATDEYLADRDKLASQPPAERDENPAWYVHAFEVPQGAETPSFGLLLNLVSVLNAESPAMIWDYLARFTVEDMDDDGYVAFVDTLISCAIRYYQDFVKPNKVYRPPTDVERAALIEFADRLQELPSADPELIQKAAYDVGNAHFKPLKGWFDCLYQVLLGQAEGPRIGMFVALYGIDNFNSLVRKNIS